jgi:hypothetical protein
MKPIPALRLFKGVDLCQGQIGDPKQKIGIKLRLLITGQQKVVASDRAWG